MPEKYYVIQFRLREREKWTTFRIRYATVQEAKEEMRRRRYTPGKYYRIAEAYYQVRYKAVKTESHEGGMPGE